MPKNIKSKAQAALFGAAAAGKATKATGLTPAKAKESLTGVKTSKLPKRVKKKRY